MSAITDKRIQKLNETFQSIRIIKFFAWENRFFESIMKVRNQEIHGIEVKNGMLGRWCICLVYYANHNYITFILLLDRY